MVATTRALAQYMVSGSVELPMKRQVELALMRANPIEQAVQAVACWEVQAVQGYWHWVQVRVAWLRKKPEWQVRQVEGVRGEQVAQRLDAAQGRQWEALWAR